MIDDFVRTLTEMLGTSGLDELTYDPTAGSAEALELIRESLARGRVTLVLGAGVSKDSKLAEWKPLVDGAVGAALSGTSYEEMIPLLQSGRFSTLSTIRLIEHLLEINAAFRSFLLRELYRSYDPSSTNLLLRSVADLILGNGTTPAISDVITYNFDNLLELKLAEEIGRRGLSWTVRAIHSRESYSSADHHNSINVYHVHGYLPYGVAWKEIAANPIVFSERDYHRHYLTGSFWANAIQFRAFSASQCLFVGLSMTDPNIRRLLDQTLLEGRRPSHHAVMRASGGTGDVRSAYLENCIRGTDLNSLGVQPIWVDEYSDIPVILDGLRTV